MQYQYAFHSGHRRLPRNRGKCTPEPFLGTGIQNDRLPALAFVAAKLALGYTLNEIGEMNTPNSAYVAPQLDYMICKIPRWDLSKFAGVSRQIGSSMKSVGEIMSIGKSFEEIIQKGLRMVGQGMHGFVCNSDITFENLDDELANPTDMRMFAIAAAFEKRLQRTKTPRVDQNRSVVPLKLQKTSTNTRSC